jgi:Fur family peroxide stress response transcriptional regulator
MLRKYPGVSFATIYNSLSKLVNAGEIKELDIDPHKKRFDPEPSPHHHFYCKTCGKVYDIEHDISLPPKMKRIGGHRVETIQLNFKGVCKTCSR